MDETERLRKFVKLMDETNLQELEWEKDGLRIVLKKAERGILKENIPTKEQAAGSAPEETGVKGKGETNLVEVKSKMVGTFYRAPAPDMPAFVKEDTVVKKGDRLCVIEAMKIMREVTAETGGKIVKVLLANGDPVEYGQVLFLLEPEPRSAGKGFTLPSSRGVHPEGRKKESNV